MSTFAAHHTRSLLPDALHAPPSASASVVNVQPQPQSTATTATRDALRELLLSLGTPPVSPSDAQRALDTLRRLRVTSDDADPEQSALQHALLATLTVSIYADALQTCLGQAAEAESAAEWWQQLETSRSNAALYLLQTLPLRLQSAARALLHALDAHNLPLRPSSLTPSSIRRLFPPPSAFHPTGLTTALFPHLRTSTYVPHPSLRTLTKLSDLPSRLVRTLLVPLDLVLDECRAKRRELEGVRDDRAEALGALSGMRSELGRVLSTSVANPVVLDLAGGDDALLALLGRVHQAVGGPSMSVADTLPTGGSWLDSLSMLAQTTLPSHKARHAAALRDQQLLRPSRLVLLWPRLVFLPPLTLLAIRAAYSRRDSLSQTWTAAREAVYGFWHGYVLEPLSSIIKTVRTGGDQSLIVRKEGVEAEYKSLERMTLALARDKLRYDAAQLDELAKQIRLGDLTPVLQIYEEDIKSPLRSAATGTLLRSVFIQVQKAKVDIEHALAGIDKLLRSQELTFAFVGVAPALAIVYFVGGFARTLVFGRRTGARFGGSTGTVGTWTAIRRIERLLVAEPHASVGAAQTLPPLTSGLLLLSVARLRTFAETRLPQRSLARAAFLEDVADLEDPSLTRADKMRVVDRMWRCWSGPMGWARAGEDGKV